MNRKFWFMLGLTVGMVLVCADMYYARASDPYRMLKLPCAKGVACREIVVDTAWMQVVEIKEAK